MLEDLNRKDKLIGVKQCRRALRDGMVSQAFFAKDADERLLRPLIQLCEERRVPYIYVATMQELGNASGIEVGAAVTVILLSNG